MKKIKLRKALIIGLISFGITMLLNIVLIVVKFPLANYIGYLILPSLFIGLMELINIHTTRYNGFKIFTIPFGTTVAIWITLWLLKTL